MVCMFLCLGGTQCSILISVSCFPLWPEAMEIPHVHGIWSEGCCEVSFSRAATIHTNSSSVRPFVCTRSVIQLVHQASGWWKHSKRKQWLPCSEQAWLSPRSPNLVPQLHLSHRVAPGVWCRRSECCRFASQWDWWVFERPILQQCKQFRHMLSSLAFEMKVSLHKPIPALLPSIC